MTRTSKNFSTASPRGFTLIEIMVTVGIILILATILLAVGTNVRRKAEESNTRAEVKALEGIVEQFQRETNTTLPVTLYDTDGHGAIVPHTGSPAVNYIDLLFRYPATKDQLANLAGEKLKIAPGTPSKSAILDSFGNPISFIPQGVTPGSWTNASTQTYLRSSGADGITDWTTQSNAQNSDDILSYEAAR
jgi:prepilin-type N-terminal cleavage/methylation domain-containing protein